MPLANSRHHRAGFTMTEVMVVIGLLVVIIAILLPALAAVRSQSLMANSMSNLRQVATFVQLYASDNRETIVPSQFDYSEANHRGNVRIEIPSGDPTQVGVEHQGTWADILWTVNGLGPVDPVIATTLGYEYRYSVPDRALYDLESGFKNNPFRSVARNRFGFAQTGTPGDGPKPYGSGAEESGLPGFFAANDFFNARSDAPVDADGNPPPAMGRWYSTGQIRFPDRSMFVVDSFAGSVIAPEEEPYDNTLQADGSRTIEVDFRYTGNAIMLFLDGHVDPISPWDDLDHLQSDRGIRVQNLDRR